MLGRGESTFGTTAPERGTRFSYLYRRENFMRSGAENPPLDLPRPGAATDFLLYIEETISALGRGESTFGSTAPGFSAPGRGESTFGSTVPERGNDFLFYIGIENFLRSGAENPPLDLPRPGAERFFLYIGEKNFCARARRIHIWIYRARARKRFSSLYRDRKFSALGRGESTFGSTAPRFSAPGRGESIFFWIYRARENFLRPGAENPHSGSTAPERGNDFLFYIGIENFLRSGAENPSL